jgi:cell division protein FtsZ
LLLIVSGSVEITIDEIGEINDYIQSEAGNSANIIMGVGEDESLGEAVSVTVIATGFDIEQQKGIVNVEPTKIIHPLNDDQINERSLFSKNNNIQPISYETPIVSNEEKIVHSLVEDDFVDEKFSIQNSETNENELVAISETIKNMNVVFEIISSKKNSDNLFSESSQVTDLKTYESKISNQEVSNVSTIIENKYLELEEEKEALTFEFDIKNEVNNIEVNEAKHFIPITEVNETGVVRYSLEEYMDYEKDLMESKPKVVENKIDEIKDEELKFTLKNEIADSHVSNSSINVNPNEMTIEETLRLRAEERKRKLKDFNYKFHNSNTRIDEMEKEPAFKRAGLQLDQPNNQSPTSRTSLGTDSNNELQIRSNNPFLHDNVD